MSPTLLQASFCASGGGLERIVAALGETASDRGWQSTVAYVTREPPPGVRCDYVRLRGGNPASPRWPMALGRLVRRIKPDLVHLHGPLPGSVGAFAVRAGSWSTPIVYTDHFVHRLRPAKYRVARHLAARLPDMNIAVCEAVARSLVLDAQVPPNRVVVIRNGTPIVPAVTLPSGAPYRFLYVANFSPWKSHDSLVRAFATVAAAYPVTLTLVGDGRERERVAALVRSLGLEDRVLFAGSLANPWSEADGAWAYVHFSSGEGIPLAVMEAMMRGLPVIGTAVGGIPEIIRDGETGLLVPPGDEAALARAVKQLITNPRLRDNAGSAARSFALSELDMRGCLERHFELYDGLVGSAVNRRKR